MAKPTDVERRFANDGKAYTWEQFEAFFGSGYGERCWLRAKPAKCLAAQPVERSAKEKKSKIKKTVNFLSQPLEAHVPATHLSRDEDALCSAMTWLGAEEQEEEKKVQATLLAFGTALPASLASHSQQATSWKAKPCAAKPSDPKQRKPPPPPSGTKPEVLPQAPPPPPAKPPPPAPLPGHASCIEAGYHTSRNHSRRRENY